MPFERHQRLNDAKVSLFIPQSISKYIKYTVEYLMLNMKNWCDDVPGCVLHAKKIIYRSGIKKILKLLFFLQEK